MFCLVLSILHLFLEYRRAVPRLNLSYCRFSVFGTFMTNKRACKSDLPRDINFLVFPACPREVEIQPTSPRQGLRPR